MLSLNIIISTASVVLSLSTRLLTNHTEEVSNTKEAKVRKRGNIMLRLRQLQPYFWGKHIFEARHMLALHQYLKST
jgi:hypothetical protein